MKTCSLFVYGTLCDPELRRRLLAREVSAQPARLRGYRAFYLKNQFYPALRRVAGAVTPGLLLQGLNATDMRRLDDYEGELYTRRKLKVYLGYQGAQAWVYTLRQGHGRQLSDAAYRFY